MLGNGTRRSTSSLPNYGQSRLRLPSERDNARATGMTGMTGGETSLEQRLRDRDANNRLVTERDSLKEQLKEAWASKDALQNVMEVECRTLVQRLQDLEGDLSSGRAERETMAEELASLEDERDKWKQTCISTSQGLEDVLEERDMLKNDLEDARRQIEQLRAGVVPDTTVRPAPAPAARPTVVVTKPDSWEPSAAPLEFDSLEGVLIDLQDGVGVSEDDIQGVLASAAEIYLSSGGAQAIIEIDVDTSGGEQEVNVCGDLQGQVEKLWRVFEINGEPDDDNPFIFNGDIFQDSSLDLAMALFCLKAIYPDSVHILRSGSQGSPPAGKHAAAMAALTQALPLGAMLNNQVLILHADLFEDDCRRAISPPTSPGASVRNLPTPDLLPYPSADPMDPVFLQQLKGLESSKDTTVATIRVGEKHILLPDNSRFMVFRQTKQFGCVAYFGMEEDTMPAAAPPPTRQQPMSARERMQAWDQQPRNDGSQSARGGVTSGGYSSGSSYISGSVTHRSHAPEPSSVKVKAAPKLAYNASQHTNGGASGSPKPSRLSPPQGSYTKSSYGSASSKGAAAHDSNRAAVARSKVPSLNLGALAAMERQAGTANASGTGIGGGIPPGHKRGVSERKDEAVKEKIPSGSLSSRVERVAARYAQEYMRGSTTARDTVDSKPKSGMVKPGQSALQSQLRRPAVVSRNPPGAASRWR